MVTVRKRIGLTAFVVAIIALHPGSSANAQQDPDVVSWDDVLQQEPGWYRSDEAVRIADNVLLYQQANGGWGKNVDMARVLNADKRERLRDERVETTIDNGASFTQARFLAMVYDAAKLDRFRAGVEKGLDYLLEAQYENGGWPQYYPIRKGYYEHVTYNDGAMIGVMRVLRDAARGHNPFGFVDEARRMRAQAAVERGIAVILSSQITVDGHLTAWCAQHDRETLQPQEARSYELPSLSGMESVGIIRFLMEIENPAPEIVRAVESAAEWFDAVKLDGIAVVDKEDPSLPRGYDRVVVSDPSAPPLWARFYEIGTNRPFFCGRDGIVRYSLAEIEHERRVGYRWYGTFAQELLEKEYPVWRKKLAARK